MSSVRAALVVGSANNALLLDIQQQLFQMNAQRPQASHPKP